MNSAPFQKTALTKGQPETSPAAQVQASRSNLQIGTAEDLRAAFVRCLHRIYPSGHFMLPRIKGLTAAAKSLGVTRTHLSLVLHGHRQSESLLRRYSELYR